MKNIPRIVFISLFLFLTVTTGFYVGTYFHKDPPENLASNHQIFHKMLNLTPEQQEKLAPIEEKFSEQKTYYERQIHLANMELGDIMKQEKAYTPKVQEAVKKVHIAMGQLQRVTLVHFFDMRAILDKRQARILDNYVADALHGL